MDLEITDELLTTTRTVRKRLDLTRPVPRDVLVECVRIAQQAPNGANLQGWRWLVVTEPNVKADLAEVYRRGGEQYLSSTIAKTSSTRDARAQEMYADAQRFADQLQDVPALVVVCAKGRVDGAPNPVAASFYGSIFPAVWSFMLAARARGLGTSFTTAHLHAEAAAAELLGIPDNVTQVTLIPVAYFTGDTFRPAPRRPVNTVVYWDHWGTTDDTLG